MKKNCYIFISKIINYLLFQINAFTFGVCKLILFGSAIDFCFRRGVLVLEPENNGGEAVDITPKEFGVRTLAQEYGGGAFTVSGDVVFFANYNDQRLYKQSISSLGEH